MSLYAQVQQTFGRGIRVTMDLPQDFAWEDKAIPLKLNLTSHPSQPDAIAHVRFHLYDEEQGTRSNCGTENGVNHRWVMEEPVALASGTSLVLPVQVPLPFDVDALPDEIAATRQGESFAEKLAASLTLGALLPPTHLTWFRLRASVKAEGAFLGARASGKIRCRNASRQPIIGPFRR